MLDTHEHIYTKVDMINVRLDNIKYASGKPMAILVRRCECGKEIAFEYGERDVMQELLDEINK